MLVTVKALIMSNVETIHINPQNYLFAEIDKKGGKFIWLYQRRNAFDVTIENTEKETPLRLCMTLDELGMTPGFQKIMAKDSPFGKMEPFVFSISSFKYARGYYENNQKTMTVIYLVGYNIPTRTLFTDSSINFL